MVNGVLFDVDGTLVDTNYLHAVAWSDAFAQHGHDIPMSTLHRLIGQGSDRLVASAIGRHDDAIVAAHADLYAPRLHSLRPFQGARADRSGDPRTDRSGTATAEPVPLARFIHRASR
jgi:beta-phosphoglucomutase-like phosphatase (HAD superfamily)